jgi:hypothetical protein
METYTIGETPEDVILRNLPHKYRMELNREDMVTVLAALYEYWCSDQAPNEEDHRENAISLRSSILETIDIEEV